MLEKQTQEFLHCMALTTRIPIDKFIRFDEKTMMSSLVFLPFVGAVVGLFGAFLYIVFSYFVPHQVGILFTITFLVLITGAFEEDALADAVDGFGGGSTRKKVLRIMRDSRIGTYGTLALILAIMFEYIFLLYIPEVLVPKLIFFAFLASRFTALPLIWKLQYVDDSSSFVKAFNLYQKDIKTWSLFALGGVIFLVGFYLFGIQSFFMMSALGLVTFVTGWYYNNRIQGVTGDCLGATLKISELVVLFFGVKLVSG